MEKTVEKEKHGVVDKLYDVILGTLAEAMVKKADPNELSSTDKFGNDIVAGDYVAASGNGWNAKLEMYHVHEVVSSLSIKCTLVKSKAKRKQEITFRGNSVVKVDAQNAMYYKLRN